MKRPVPSGDLVAVPARRVSGDLAAVPVQRLSGDLVAVPGQRLSGDLVAVPDQRLSSGPPPTSVGPVQLPGRLPGAASCSPART